MGHTKPPFTWQFKIEEGYFSKFRRALLLAEDKRLFDRLWNRAEFHIPAAEKAAHPLPIATILVMMNLEQEKVIQRLEEKISEQAGKIEQLEQEIGDRDAEVCILEAQVEGLRVEMEETLRIFREELLEIRYPVYVS